MFPWILNDFFLRDVTHLKKNTHKSLAKENSIFKIASDPFVSVLFLTIQLSRTMLTRAHSRCVHSHTGGSGWHRAKMLRREGQKDKGGTTHRAVHHSTWGRVTAPPLSYESTGWGGAQETVSVKIRIKQFS